MCGCVRVVGERGCPYLECLCVGVCLSEVKERERERNNLFFARKTEIFVDCDNG